MPLSLLPSYSKRKDRLERGQCLTPSSGQRACAWQAASSVRTRTAGSDPGLETLGGRNLGSTVFLVTSAFQESKVVSPLSAGVCKQNAHLPVAPQTHSSQLQVGGSACGFRGSPETPGTAAEAACAARSGLQTPPCAGEPDGGAPSGGHAPGGSRPGHTGWPCRAHGASCTFGPRGQAVRCECFGGGRCREGCGWRSAEEEASVSAAQGRGRVAEVGSCGRWNREKPQKTPRGFG